MGTLRYFNSRITICAGTLFQKKGRSLTLDWTAQCLPGTPSMPDAIRGGGGGTPPGGRGGGGGGLLPDVGLASSKPETSPVSSAAFEKIKTKLG